jgi:hypothetical protein
VNAVLRKITNMCAMRDRSVVRSSVMPSARYCWSGSLLRLPKGSTTIDKRGVTRGCNPDVVGTGGLEALLVAGQCHQPITAITSTAVAAAAIAAAAMRRRCGVEVSVREAGRSATAAGLSAWTRTGRAMFLTLCSPRSSNG